MSLMYRERQHKLFAHICLSFCKNISILLAETSTLGTSLKGVWHEIFALRLFHKPDSPGPLSIPLGPYKNLRRYSKVWVNHRCKKKVWDRKLFHFMLRCCWVVDYTHLMIFYFMFTLRCSKAHIVRTVSSPVSRPPVINYRQFHCYRLLVNAGVVTGDKLIAGIMESMKIWDKA